MSSLPPILRFHATYLERIWGGTLLRDVLHMPAPADKVIGEAWLIADHPHCESVVAGGPLAGATLRELIVRHGRALLGAAAPTPEGRFPLLLKLIDAGDLLSVQVHPDDSDAIRLGEPDVGKTEMWYVLHAASGAQLIYGLKPGATRAAFEAAIAAGETLGALQHHAAPAGTGVFVPAGTVHAIGAGLLIAEIQQNSDITYRIHDYDRCDPNGNPRELHINKALEVIRFDGAVWPLRSASPGDAMATELAACAYFSTRYVPAAAAPVEITGGAFSIVLAAHGETLLKADGDEALLAPGEAALLPATTDRATLTTTGAALHYAVPRA